ncbi:unnamed protein product [Heligmosomoides polygyrus]|uniref:Uncharacterized protein n=1 Tax=Heligmosomoides polygyrus TaxID=6339 RepID=A0A3P8HXH1_HELPZ|nr:unnamed protein product [Heligmosomoides polygyrus]
MVANNQVVFSHLEQEWGDKADVNEVRKAIEKFK